MKHSQSSILFTSRTWARYFRCRHCWALYHIFGHHTQPALTIDFSGFPQPCRLEGHTPDICNRRCLWSDILPCGDWTWKLFLYSGEYYLFLVQKSTFQQKHCTFCVEKTEPNVLCVEKNYKCHVRNPIHLPYWISVFTCRMILTLGCLYLHSINLWLNCRFNVETYKRQNDGPKGQTKNPIFEAQQRFDCVTDAQRTDEIRLCGLWTKDKTRKSPAENMQRIDQ